MIIKSAEFVKSAVKPAQYPDAVLPEFAFTGRSNVGKSSLINTLVNRKRLVKTSATPGRTGVALIMDVRRIPGIQDLNFIEWLYYYNIPGILILTKADKLSKTKRLTQQATIAKALSVDKNDLVLFSAKSRLGKDVVWDAIEGLIGY